MKNLVDNNYYFIYTILCIIIFCSNLTANLFAQRVIEINIWNIHTIVTGGVFVFPITFMILDIITERYGPYFSTRAIFINIFGLSLFMLMTKSLLAIHPAHIFVKDSAYQYVVGTSFLTLLCTVVSSLTAYSFNCFILNKLRKRYNGNFFWARAIFSTSLGEIVYSLVWVVIFFHSKLSPLYLYELIFAQIVIKILFEICTMPISYIILYFLSLSSENVSNLRKVKIYE